jgi:hypothetical protein
MGGLSCQDLLTLPISLGTCSLTGLASVPKKAAAGQRTYHLSISFLSSPGFPKDTGLLMAQGEL